MPIKYILPDKKSYPFSDICPTLFVKSVIFFLAFACSVLFEVSFLFKFFSLPSEYVFFEKADILFLFACAYLAARSSNTKLLDSSVVIYLLL